MANISGSVSPSNGNEPLMLVRSCSWWSIAAVIFILHVTLCSALRFRRFKHMNSRFHYPDRASLARMTTADAQAISSILGTLEFPFSFDFGLRYALLKSYTLDNVGTLLSAVSDFAKPKKAAKRYEDTKIIFVCFLNSAPSSARLHKAVARMNYLHAPYINSGRILNQDLLHVLYLSMAEPLRFVRLYEWRSLSDMELAAHATLWKHIGDLMEISFAKEFGKNAWQNPLEFLDDFTAWGLKYEEEHIRFVPEVRRLGDILIDMMLSTYPPILRPVGYQIILVVLGERMRRALGLPEAGIAVSALTYGLLRCRRLWR